MNATRRGLYHDQAIDQLASFLTQIPDPDVILDKLGLSRIHLRTLEGDDEIFTALETRREAVISTPWRLEPGESPVAEFIDGQLTPHMTGILRGAWNAVAYGYTVMEAVYARSGDGGRIGLARIGEKPFEWFTPERDGTLRYFPIDGAGGVEGMVVDTRIKFFLTRRQATWRNPYGEALLSRLYWPWFFRAQGARFWAVFLERFGQPLLVGHTDGDRETMAESLMRAVQDAVVAVGSGDKVEAIAPANAGESFSRFSSTMEKRIQKVILGQTLTTDVDGKGSYAAAKVHDQVREDRRQSDLRLVTDTVQRIIDALTVLNFPAAESPRFVMEDVQGLEDDRAARDVKLTQANPALKFTDAYYRDVYGLEAEHFEMSEPPKPPPPALPPQTPVPPPEVKASTGRTPAATFADGPSPFTPDQQEVESLADAALERAANPIPPERIRAVIAAATDPEDLANRLADLAGGEPDQAFQALLERTLFTADVLGYGAAEKDA